MIVEAKLTQGQQPYKEKKKVDVTIDFTKLANEKANLIVRGKALAEEQKKLEMEKLQQALAKVLAISQIQQMAQPLYDLAGKLQLQQSLLDAKIIASDTLPQLKKKDGLLPTLDETANAAPVPPMPPEMAFGGQGAPMPMDMGQGMPMGGPAGMPPGPPPDMAMMGGGMPPQGMPMGMPPQGMPMDNGGMPPGIMPPPPGMM